MGENTLITWTDSTFNPWVGCTKVSAGCVNCYAANNRCVNMLHVGWGDAAERHVISDATWHKPYAWNRAAESAHKPTRVFCGSLCDFLDLKAPAGQRERLFQTIADTPWLIWLLLTKRSGNFPLLPDPIPANAWVGVTAENQEALVVRVHDLEQVKAAVRFVSYEPALSPLDLSAITPGVVDWLICGCESGPNRRPMPVQWARSVRDECKALGIAFFMKQMEINGKVSDQMRDFPRDLRIRQFPRAMRLPAAA